MELNEANKDPTARRSVKAEGKEGSIKAQRRMEAEIVRHSQREILLSTKRLSPAPNRSPTPSPEAQQQQQPTVNVVVHVVELIKGKEGVEKRLEGLKELRAILCAFPGGGAEGEITPAKIAVDNNVVPALGECLTFTGSGSVDCSEIQFEAALCATNIAAGAFELTKACLPLAPLLVVLLSSGNLPLKNQAAWALANISSDSSELRDAVKSTGAVFGLVKLIRSLQGSAERDNSVIRTCLFALTNLFRGPGAKLDEIERDSGTLELLIQQLKSENIDVAIECSWLFAYLTAHSEDICSAIVKTGSILPLLVQRSILSSQEIALSIPSLRIIGLFTQFKNRISLYS